MRATHPITLLFIVAVAAALVPWAGTQFVYADDEKAAASDDKYSAEELMEIVGPIALYPDVVLGSVLPASTFPTDVVQAARWVEQQEGEIDGAPKDSGWDGSVEALVQYPDVLIWMSENLDWMEQLAWAVDVQQEEVLDAIQGFRQKTKEAGNLETNEQVQVIENNNVIEVQPASPEVVYVPQYNPVYVTQPRYTGWFWAGFAAGALGSWAYHSIRWGGYGRGGGSININNSPTFNFNGNGNINRPGTRPSGGKRWGSNGPSSRPGGNRPPRGKNGRPAQPRNPGWNNKRSNARPAKGGVKNPGRRPGTGQRPGGRPPSPSQRPSTRPSTAPKSPSRGSRGSGSRPDRSRPDRSRPSSGNRSGSGFGGSSRSGSSARNHSNRGRSSSSRGSSSRSRSSGSSRSRSSGGRSRGGGGGRGGGGRRR